MEEEAPRTTSRGRTLRNRARDAHGDAQVDYTELRQRRIRDVNYSIEEEKQMPEVPIRRGRGRPPTRPDTI